MLSTDTTPEGAANLAMAHIFLALMKADGNVSEGEIRKIEILSHKFRHGLPGNSEVIPDDVKEMHNTADYQKMLSMDHVDLGFAAFDKFVASGQAEEEHMETIIEMMDILAEVDGVTPNVQLVMVKIKDGLQKRYGVN